MNNKLSYNMDIARNIHKANIRSAREPLLSKLDIDYQRALETSADTTEIVAKKQALRDAPNVSAITNASDVNDLINQWDSSILGTSPYK
jgi:hypothetical protein